MYLSDDKTNKEVPLKKVTSPTRTLPKSDKIVQLPAVCSLCGGSGEHEGHSCPCGAKRM